MYKRLKSDRGFMGPTHALSAVSLFLLITWLASDLIFGSLLNSKDLAVYITSLIVVIGAALMPDLDGIQSTSMSTLGLIGRLLSKFMRFTSLSIQNTFKTKFDKPVSDPHRGFWHTAIAAVLVGFLVSLLTRITTPVPIVIMSKTVTIGMIVTCMIVFISIQLTMSSLFNSYYKKIKKGNPMGKLIVVISSLLVSILMIVTLPESVNYKWVGYSVMIGWLIHIFGDLFTVAGVPVLFPLKRKGKRWWDYRFPFKIKAGGPIEYGIITPLLFIIAIVSLVSIIPIILN